MKTFFTLATLFSLSLFALGCSQAQQLEDAQEDLATEQVESAETEAAAGADGVVTGEEASEIQEQKGDEAAAAGEVAEQAGEVIEEKTDN